MSLVRAFDLQGRGIALTGGGGHLGRAMALALAEAGAVVVITGRTAAPLESAAAAAATLPGRVVPLVADATTDEGLTATLDTVEREAGSLDGFVNNAYAGAGGRLLEVSRSDVRRTVEAGLDSVLLAVQAAARRMTPRRRGSIVNVASMYGMVAPQPAAYRAHRAWHNPPAYGAAKAGVIQLTRYAAVDLAEHGVRVNALSPGPFPGPGAQSEASFIAELEERVPLGRIGRPEELAGAVVFLLSDASSYVTGHNLVVDGGWTAW